MDQKRAKKGNYLFIFVFGYLRNFKKKLIAVAGDRTRVARVTVIL